MQSQIQELEELARLLEPSATQRHEVRNTILEYGENFLENISRIKAFEKYDNNSNAFIDYPISEEPADAGFLINLLRKYVDDPGLNPASGGHLGYIPGGGIYYSALGDYLADVFNRYSGVYFAGPGAVKMENMLISWMAGVMGYPKGSAGNLTSGGSIANLIAIVCARDHSGLKSGDYNKAVVYLTRQVHHSVEKAIRIAGLGDCVIRYVALDDHYRMNANDLDSAITEDKKRNLRPFLIIASAGTTDAGAIDPLEQIGHLAENHKLWYHIDAAYGGFFMLTESGREKLKGIELSDSLIADPHKGLFLPYGSGVVLVKDAAQLASSHHYQANYMQDAVQDPDELSPADLSPELTKHFRGLRLWLPLMLHGVRPFRACLEEKLLLAKYFYNEVQKLGFETGPEPELSVVTYRYVPAKGDADEFNRRLVKEVQEDGRVFISSTILDGKFVLRAAILAFRTHLETIDTLLQVLKEKVSFIKTTF